MEVLAVALCAMVSVIAQEPEDGRQQAFGVVRRADRSPRAEATVRLVSEPFLGAERDIVIVTTGADGRFRAGILAGQPYGVGLSKDGDVWRVTRGADRHRSAMRCSRATWSPMPMAGS